MKLITLDPAELRQRVRGERIRQMVRLLLAYSAHHGLEDVRHYFRLCSHVETLRQYGLAVRIRGKKGRWLIEIKGGNRAASSGGRPPQTKSMPSRVIPNKYRLYRISID